MKTIAKTILFILFGFSQFSKAIDKYFNERGKMKTIELKTLTGEDKFTLDYRTQMLSCVRAPLSGERGMDIEEMRKSIRVIEVLEKSEAGKWLDLEDADYEHLKTKVAAMRWNFAHQFIIQFVDDVNNAASVKKPDAPSMPPG